MTDRYEPTERTQVRRRKDRGRYERELVHAIFDEALVCHLGFAIEGQPHVLPTIHARHGETLYLHGSVSSRSLRALDGSAPCCVTATLVDGIVLARSVVHHSLNYRSAVVFGAGAEVVDRAEKELALRTVVEHVVAGRSAEARAPSEADLRGTKVIRVEIEEASAKVREGGPVDETQDLELPVWAGVLPLGQSAGAPVADEALERSLPVPDYVEGWTRGDPGAAG